MKTRTYTCPYCHEAYERVDLGYVHPEYETLPCFNCAEKVKRLPAMEGKEYQKHHQLRQSSGPVTAKGRRWGKRNGGVMWFAGAGARSRL